MQNRSVIYINFSQYDNTGRILDYLREKFNYVYHFSFDHLRLKNGRKTNLLTIYQQGKLVSATKIYSFRVPSFLMFISLPIVAQLMVIQTVYYCLKTLKKSDRTLFFTVNAYPALIGILLKKLTLVDKVYYWVWDFFPTIYPDWHMKLIRYLYLWFDTLAIHFADRLIFPNRRQLLIRNKIRKIRNHISIIPLGSSKPIVYKPSTSYLLGFMGMLKDSQGIELLLENLGLILKDNPRLKIEIVGSGPEELYYKKLAQPYRQRVKFYGFIEDQDTIDKIIRRWFAGLAVYRPIPSNESYFGDPSKIKVYLSQGVPVITTNVTEYGIWVKKYSFGKCINYTGKELLQSIKFLYKHQKTYRKRALQYSEKFYYRSLYKKLIS